MRVLLDECLPKKLRRELPEHEVRTVGEMGWGGTKNGALLRKAAGEFDFLLTIDGNLPYQQNPTILPLAVVVLVSYSNAIGGLRPLIPALRELMPNIEPGRLYHVGPV